MRIVSSNAIQMYKKSQAGIGSARKAKMITHQKLLCVYFIPHQSWLQQVEQIVRGRKHYDSEI